MSISLLYPPSTLPKMSSSPHILIVGGGLGGLTLAQGLNKNGVSFTVFERDPSPTARAQGYRVRFAEDTGIAALHECLNQELWSLFEKTCPDVTPHSGRFNAIDGTRLPQAGPGRPPPTNGPHSARTKLTSKSHNADRSMLRSLLVLGLDDKVKFGKTFQRYELISDGVKAFFEDGTVEEGTLLVGADGVASPIRRQFLPNHRYFDTRSRVIYGKTPITPELETRLSPEVFRGVTVIQDDKPLTLFLEPIRFPEDVFVASHGQLIHTENYIYWVLGGNEEHFPVSDDGFRTLSSTEAAQISLKLTERWIPGFRALFELQNIEQTSALRIISAKPERPVWPISTRVTLLGDAVHAPMPVGGVGANAAVQDASALVKIIMDGVSEETMSSYIDCMWEDAVSYIEGSLKAGQILLGFRGFNGENEVVF